MSYFSMGKVRVSHFVLQESRNPQKSFWCRRNLQRIVLNVECLASKGLPSILSRSLEGEDYAKRREKGEIHGSLLDKEVEKFDDHGCPKTRSCIKQLKKIRFARVAYSESRPQFTLQSARQNCLVTGQRSILIWKF